MGKRDWNYMPLIIALVSVFGIAIGASLSYIATIKTQEKSRLQKQRVETYVDFIEAGTRLKKLEALLMDNQDELKFRQELSEFQKQQLIKKIGDLKHEATLARASKNTARFRVALSGSPNLLKMMAQSEVHSEYSNKSHKEVSTELFKAMRTDLFPDKKDKETAELDSLICDILFPSEVINKPEKLVSFWISAVREDDLRRLIGMSKLPFYFLDGSCEKADELRLSYLELLLERDEVDINNARYRDPKRIKDIEIGDEKTELQSAISSLNLKDDEWVVMGEFGRPIKHRLFFLTQKGYEGFKLVGITLKDLQKEKEKETDRLIGDIPFSSKVITKPEELVSFWISAVREDDLPGLIRMSKLPFYFLDGSCENASELRLSYLELLLERDEVDIKNVRYKKAERIKDIEIGVENTNLKNAISSLKLKDDEWVVMGEFGRPIKYQIVFLTQKENGRFKLVGIASEILHVD